MAKPLPIPGSLLAAGDFVAAVRPDDLVYFLCNIGDGDAQVVLLPEEEQASGPPLRRVIIVDAGQQDKVPALLQSVFDKGLLGPGHAGFSADAIRPGCVALVVATHPHLDHIGGMAQVLDGLRGGIAEFWDPGYYHPSSAYHKMMAAVERQSLLLYSQPTSGLRRWFGNLAVTVLSPAIQLRNRFDTYGVEINDASLSLKLEYPAARVQQRDQGRNVVGQRRSQTLILGADAQTLSWSYVFTDYPYLVASGTDVAKALRLATGGDPLRGDVLKVSHHASKHGVNLELVERIQPALTLVSSVGEGGAYNFPHTVAQELIREALQPSTSSGAAHKPDHELGVFYTSDADEAGPLGSMALIAGSDGRRGLWRFGDADAEPVDLDKARKMTLP